MVIVYLYDEINGYRYRKISSWYYYRNAHRPMIVAAFLVPADLDTFLD